MTSVEHSVGPGQHVRPGLQERYSVLLDIARILNGTLGSDQLYHAVYEQARRVVACSGFYLSLYEPGTDVATLVFAGRGESVSWPGTTYRGSDVTAIREGRPILTRGGGDVGHPVPGSAEAEEERACVSVPMVREGMVIGLLGVCRSDEHEYDWDDLELLVAIADLTAVAVEKTRQLGEMELRKREAERLETIGRALASSLELPEVLDRIASAGLELVKADAVSIWLIRDDDTVELAFTAGPTAVGPRGTVVPLPKAMARRMLQHRRALVVDNARDNPAIEEPLRSLVQNDTLVIVPLIFDDQIIGAFTIAHQSSHAHAREEIRLLERLGQQAVIAIENARMHRHIRTLSLTDPLTGLPNRRHLELFLQTEFAAARRGRPLTVVLFDLDHFKRYNDLAGHQAGDRALQRFGAILRQVSRSMNLVARYGGDEFIAVLSGTDRAGGQAMVARVRGAVTEDPDIGSIGFSAGIGEYDPEMQEPDEVVLAADRDLYRAKESRGPDDPQ